MSDLELSDLKIKEQEYIYQKSKEIGLLQGLEMHVPIGYTDSHIMFKKVLVHELSEANILAVKLYIDNHKSIVQTKNFNIHRMNKDFDFSELIPSYEDSKDLKNLGFPKTYFTWLQSEGSKHVCIKLPGTIGLFSLTYESKIFDIDIDDKGRQMIYPAPVYQEVYNSIPKHIIWNESNYYFGNFCSEERDMRSLVYHRANSINSRILDLEYINLDLKAILDFWIAAKEKDYF